MENHAVFPRMALRVKIHDCDRCAQKLGKILLRFDGVDWVNVEAKEELVRVIGEVEPTMLIQYLGSKKIKAQLLRYEKNKKDQFDSETERRKEKEKEEEGHVKEAYEAPKIDPVMCRDPYCKLHKCRPIIQTHVPSIHSADHPHHTHTHTHTHTHGSFHIFDDDNAPFPYLPPSSPFGFHHHRRPPFTFTTTGMRMPAATGFPNFTRYI